MSDQLAAQHEECLEEERRGMALQQALQLNSRIGGDDPTAEKVLADAQKFCDFVKGNPTTK